jgi:hypothetical protein
MGCCEEHRHELIDLLKEVVEKLMKLGTGEERYLKGQSRIYLLLV